MDEERKKWLISTPAQRNTNLLLNQRNVHPRDLAIQFDEPSHTYLINGEKAQMSMTGFKELFTYPFDENKALNDVFDKTIKELQAKGVKITEKHKLKVNNPKSDYNGQTRLEVLRWNHAAPLGTKMHDRIDKFLSLNEEDIQDYTASHEKLCEKFMQDDDTEEEKHIFEQFIGVLRDFYRDGWRPYRTEWRIWMKVGDQILAGSIDAVFVRTLPGGKQEFCIVDWKRSPKQLTSVFWKGPKTMPYPLNHLPKCTLSEYGIQTEGYRYVGREFYGLNITESYIVQLKPAKTKRALPNVYKIIDLQKEVAECMRIYFQTQELKNAFNNWDTRLILKNIGSYNICVPCLRHPPFFEDENEYRKTAEGEEEE